jgi:hypothetical protein
MVVASMVACHNCGRVLEDDAYFCKFCGYPMREAQAIGGNLRNPSELRSVVERRLNAIRDKDEVVLQDVLDESVYTKFDDWPPFTLQDSKEAASNERGAYKVMKDYSYEIKDYRDDVVGDVGMAAFSIHYSGTIRDRNFEMDSRVTMIMKKSGQSWKVAHEHWSRFPETRQRRRLFG